MADPSCPLLVHCSVGYSTGYENQGNQKGWVLSDDLTQLLRENAITLQWKWKPSKAPSFEFSDQKGHFWKYWLWTFSDSTFFPEWLTCSELWSSFFSGTFASYPSMLQYGVNFVYLNFLLHIISEWAAGELRGKTADKLHQGLPNYIFNSRPLFSALHQIQATLSRIGISSTSPQIVATNKGLIAPYHVEWCGGHCKKKGFGKENLIRRILLVLFLWVRLRLTQRCVEFFIWGGGGMAGAPVETVYHWVSRRRTQWKDSE